VGRAMIASNLRRRSCSWGAVAFVVAAGCGRVATSEDCDFIVDRYVEVELRALSVSDPKIIAERKAEMRKDLKDELKACPGKHITGAMLACVRKANTNAELDQCTRW
jgi:hypothetical protein